METGLKNKILDLLEIANSCLTLHQVLDGVRQNHHYLVSLRLKTIGALRDFLLQFPRDFAVVDEMVCSIKNSKIDYSKIPPLENSPPTSAPLRTPKPCLKRSVSFVEPSTLAPVSNSASNQTSHGDTSNAKAAFSRKIKTVVKKDSSDHGPECVCDKLSVYEIASVLTEADLILINVKCLIASYMKVVKVSKTPKLNEMSCQTDITFDPKEDL